MFNCIKLVIPSVLILLSISVYAQKYNLKPLVNFSKFEFTKHIDSIVPKNITDTLATVDIKAEFWDNPQSIRFVDAQHTRKNRLLRSIKLMHC